MLPGVWVGGSGRRRNNIERGGGGRLEAEGHTVSADGLTGHLQREGWSSRLRLARHAHT